MIADVQQVIECVRKLYFDRSLVKSLGANGSNFVKDYAVSVQADRWHSIFRKLASQD